MSENDTIKIVKIGNYYFCPSCNDRLLVDKQKHSCLCICCGFSYISDFLFS